MEEPGGDSDNLANNLFLRVLRAKYRDVWAKAEDELLFVCVPAAGSFAFPGNTITREVVESHIMREKLFVGRFETLNGKEVKLEGNKLSTGEGWSVAAECRILFEELFYNKSWQKFRVVCIDRALVGGVPPGADGDIPKLPSLALRNLKNSKLYLEAFPENELVLKKLRQYVETFVSSYYIVKGFEHHARDKVKGLIQKGLDDLLCTNKVYRQYHYEDRNMDALSQVVENYMFEGLHKKLFSSMCEMHRDQDTNLSELAVGSRDVLTLAQMGTGETFSAPDLPQAIAVFKSMEERITPLEKLLCLKESVDAINHDLNEFRSLKESNGSAFVMTSDELLPLLVFVIVRCNVSNLTAHLHYAEMFTFFNVQTSELGFCLASFNASLTLMMKSQLLRKNRRERFPESRFLSDEKKRNKSLSARRSHTVQNMAPVAALPRTVSVPGELNKVDALYTGVQTGSADQPFQL